MKSVSFGEAVKSFFKNYTNFTGRATRREFWFPMLFVLLIRVINVVFIVAAAFVAVFTSPELLRAAQNGDAGYVTGNIPGWLTGVGWVSTVILLFFLLPSVTALVRRLHDTGRSGLYALGIFIPLASVVLTPFVYLSPVFSILVSVIAVASLAYLIVLIVFAAQDSTGDNKYGPRRVDPSKPKVINPPPLVTYPPELESVVPKSSPEGTIC